TVPPESQATWVGDEWAWDVDTYKEGWYLVALPNGWDRKNPRSGRYYWSELYVDESVNALMITVSLPIYSPKKSIVGVATVDVSLSTLQKMVSSFSLPTPSTQIAGFSTVNNATFAVSGSDKYDIVEYPEGSWLAQLKGLEPGQNLNKTVSLDGKSYSLTASVHQSGVGVAILIPDEEKYASVDALQKKSIVTIVAIVLAMIAIIILAVFALSNWIVKPINRAFSVLETFAKGDLTQTISSQGSDELAQMTRMIDKTQDGIRNLIAVISEKIRILSQNSQDLSSVAVKLVDSANDTVAKSDAVTGTTENMANNISNMAKDAEQASMNANEVASTAEEMSVNMNTVASAIEEMSASIGQIASNADEARQVAGEANTKANDATSAMNKLGSAAKEIGQVTDVIKKIADKTNLLALNATIEAASAGEAGKGFAVVAGEIKELANQSAQSADDIANRIEGIQSGTNNAVNVINDVSEIIIKINQSVEAIAGHVEQQTKASNEIALNVSQANTGSKRVASAIGEVARSASDVSNNASQAARGANDVNSNVSGMNHVARESAQNATQVNRSSGDLSKIADELKQTINHFKV
ncbi:MAG: methyl-accepting chemotaxis protein, partial [Fibromonadaceae bacterium]|nr:methyl-accepting chemotaxis protein [Fibromonadaceae bacterium]